MKRKLLIFANTILVSIFALFGCESDGEENEIVCMYGCPPTNSVLIQGKVVNEDSEPIENIQFEVEHIFGYTDNNGLFRTELYNTNDPVQFIFTDIDGAENGEYQNDTISRTPDGSQTMEFVLKKKNSK